MENEVSMEVLPASSVAQVAPKHPDPFHGRSIPDQQVPSGAVEGLASAGIPVQRSSYAGGHHFPPRLDEVLGRALDWMDRSRRDAAE
jgi:hypothetical protein